MARDQIPGVAVGVVERGHLSFARGFGYRDVEKHLPVTPDTLFSSRLLLQGVHGYGGRASRTRAGWARHSRAQVPSRLFAARPRGLRDFDAARSSHAQERIAPPRSLLVSGPVRARRALRAPSIPRAQRPSPHAVAIQQPDVRRRRLHRREGFGRELGELAGVSILVPLDMRRTLLSAEAMEADADHASPLRDPHGQRTKDTHAEGLERHRARGSRANERAGVARWLTFHATRSPGLLDDGMWRELHRPQAEMPKSDQPEVWTPITPWVDPSELPRPSPGGPQRRHRRIRGIWPRDRTRAH